MDENTVCTRIDVEHIVEKSTLELKEAVKELRREHGGWQEQLRMYMASEEKRSQENEKRMVEIATATVVSAKDNIMKFVGWGGIAGIVGVFYFFGGLTNKVDNMSVQLKSLEDSQKGIQDFMTNTNGNRFTLDDGNQLKNYVDQNDNYLQRQITDIDQTMKEGFAELKDLLVAHTNR